MHICNLSLFICSETFYYLVTYFIIEAQHNFGNRDTGLHITHTLLCQLYISQ